MLTLYHHLLCPKSRLARILLSEANIDFQLISVDFWRQKEKLLSIDPLGELPIIITSMNSESSGSNPIISIYSIIEYILEMHPGSHLIPSSISERALMRKLIYWINNRFDLEVTKYIINEKLIKLISNDKDGPRTNFIRAAKINLTHHLNYFLSYIETNGNMASSNISVSDIFLASHISTLDYFGEINWDKSPILKDWYAPIKSRPSFRKILADRISLIKPPLYYENPDF